MEGLKACIKESDRYELNCTRQIFDMIIDKKSNISFGTAMEREIFPTKMAPTRLGNDLSPMRGAPNRGPGCYNNEEEETVAKSVRYRTKSPMVGVSIPYKVKKVSNLVYVMDKKITSEKGYTLGARTAQRFGTEQKFVSPSPDRYQTQNTEPKQFEPAYKPFCSSADRFQIFKRDRDQVTPGTGTYEYTTKANRKVDWHQSFGGTPTNLPSIKQHSTIDKNTDKLHSTKEEKKYHRRLAYLKLYY